MSDLSKTLHKWNASFKKGTDFDSWGQLVEAIDEYQILARQLQKEAQSPANSSDFTEDQKKIIGKLATCLELRSAALQSTQSQEGFKLEDIKKLEPVLDNLLTFNKEFPFDVQPVPLRRILAPGEEENLEVEEEEEEGGAGVGSPDSFPARVPGAIQGTLLPRLPSEPGMTLLTIRIEKIGLKDAGQCIDPYMTVSVKDINGIDLTPVQDTPMASRKEDTYVHFNVETEIQKHVAKLTKGAAIFFEFKLYKPKKRFTSAKGFAFMEMDEIKPGQIVIELYKKPTDFKRKKTAAANEEATVSPLTPDIAQGLTTLTSSTSPPIERLSQAVLVPTLQQDGLCPTAIRAQQQDPRYSPT